MCSVLVWIVSSHRCFRVTYIPYKITSILVTIAHFRVTRQFNFHVLTNSTEHSFLFLLSAAPPPHHPPPTPLFFHFFFQVGCRVYLHDPVMWYSSNGIFLCLSLAFGMSQCQKPQSHSSTEPLTTTLILVRCAGF